MKEQLFLFALVVSLTRYLDSRDDVTFFFFFLMGHRVIRDLSIKDLTVEIRSTDILFSKVALVG